jgi:hypothetical protein
MRYAVLGTGVVGRAVAGKLASLGHEVVVGTRDPRATLDRDDSFAGWLHEHETVRPATFAEAAEGAEAVVNATGGAASLAALTAAGAENLAGKLLIDIANPLVFAEDLPRFEPVDTDSLGEQIQRAFPEAKVVKSLNTMNADVMVDPALVPGEHNVFVSGDDAGAKQAVTDLLVSIGWPRESVIDLGDITTARGAEMLVAAWLRVSLALGHHTFNFHIAGARRG